MSQRTVYILGTKEMQARYRTEQSNRLSGTLRSKAKQPSLSHCTHFSHTSTCVLTCVLVCTHTRTCVQAHAHTCMHAHTCALTPTQSSCGQLISSVGCRWVHPSWQRPAEPSRLFPRVNLAPHEATCFPTCLGVSFTIIMGWSSKLGS